MRNLSSGELKIEGNRLVEAAGSEVGEHWASEFTHTQVPSAPFLPIVQFSACIPVSWGACVPN